MARRSLKSQLNQIRSWVRQGRTDAWIAHQLEVPVRDIGGFKREHDLAPDTESGGNGEVPRAPEEVDLRAEDDALVAAELDAEPAEPLPAEEAQEDEGALRRRRRGRRGGRTRRRAGDALEGTFDHGEEGYGLWLDPAVQDDPVYAEHWAGHRPVTVSVEPDQIVIRRSGEDAGEPAPAQAAAAPEPVESAAAPEPAEEAAAEEKPKPRRRSRSRKAAPPPDPEPEAGPNPDDFDA
jgi:hypothetical protein